MSSIPIERSVDPIVAIAHLEKTLNELKIEWKIDVTGRNILTRRCLLFGDGGHLLDYGYGKGDAAACSAGALFEATEHWFGQFRNSDQENVTYCDSSEFLRLSPLAKNLPISIMNGSSSAILPFRIYEQLCGTNKLTYPVALSNPRYVDDSYAAPSVASRDTFDYSHIGKYCTNSGMAIGSNEQESLIHGICEAIERDSLSKFLVEAFLYRKEESLRVIRPDSLPPNLQTLLLEVEDETRHAVILLELHNKYDIPVFCATLRNSHFSTEISGFGCSLSRENALTRSLHELVQCYHCTIYFNPRGFAEKSKIILERFGRFGFHRRCAEFKISRLCNEVGFVPTDFSTTPDGNVSRDLNTYLEQICFRVLQSGRRIYWTMIKRLPGGQVITHSFIEGQDNFFCVTEGSFVLPDIEMSGPFRATQRHSAIN